MWYFLLGSVISPCCPPWWGPELSGGHIWITAGACWDPMKTGFFFFKPASMGVKFILACGRAARGRDPTFLPGLVGEVTSALIH